jgi:hypothetical protein
MQIGGEGIENMFINMVLKKKNFIKTNLKRRFSMLLYLGIGPILQNVDATFWFPFNDQPIHWP